MRRTLLTLLLAGLTGHAASGPSQPDPPRMPGRLVDVGGWRLHVTCDGDRKPGEPVVVLEAGGDDFSATWSLVQPKVAAFARVCSYDRAGSGWSDLGPNPRTMRQTVYELHTLLSRADVAPPYVLVGHSFGGFLVRLYASTHPGDVAGLVLVDASYEEDLVGFKGKMMRWWEEATGAPVPPIKTSGPMRFPDFSDAVRDRAERAATQCGRVNAPPFDKLPMAAQLARTWTCSQPRTHLPGETAFDGDEAVGLRTERQHIEYPLKNRPLVVVTRGVAGYGREPLAEQREQERHVHQAEMAKLSSRGTQVIAEGSGHQVPIEAPDVVVQAIRDVLGRAER